MPNLFLSSSFESSYHQIETNFNTSLNGKTVAFFDTASRVEEYSDYVDASFDLFENELMAKPFRVDLSDKNLPYTIQNTDIIFIAGGNTFYLLQELKKSGADELIKTHINAGKLYIGESAGSVIMSPNINYIKYMDELEKAPDLVDQSGLHLVETHPVPHAKSDYLGESAQAIIDQYQDKINLTILTDDDALIIKD